ncbi:MAG: metallophosphoesterase [Promethearchaeota archaeon]
MTQKNPSPPKTRGAYLKDALRRNVLSKRGAVDVVKRLFLTFLVLSPIVVYLGVRYVAVRVSARAKAPWVIWSHEGIDPANSVQVWWETETPTGTALWLSDDPSATFVKVADSSAATTMHVVTLVGLSPDTRYYYKVGSAGNPARSFRTAPAADVPFNFTMISDTQAMWGTGHMPRVAAAIARIRDTAFVSDVGDLVQDGDYQPYWDYFFHTNDPWLSKFGFVPVPGNHDERGGFNESSLWTKYFNYSTSSRRLYYAFNWSNVLFVSMQIAVGSEESALVDGGDQRRWLEGVLGAAQDKAFRVVMFHRQVYSTIPLGDSEAFIETWLPTFDAYNVSLVVHGHHHTYQRFWDGNRTYICLGGGGGLVDLSHMTKPGNQHVNPIPNYMVGSVDGDRMVVSVYTPAGELVDSVTLENRPATHRAEQVAGGSS